MDLVSNMEDVIDSIDVSPDTIIALDNLIEYLQNKKATVGGAISDTVPHTIVTYNDAVEYLIEYHLVSSRHYD